LIGDSHISDKYREKAAISDKIGYFMAEIAPEAIGCGIEGDTHDS
jgi:hypothetical protein